MKNNNFINNINKTLNNVLRRRDGENPYVHSFTTKVPIETCNIVDIEISMICSVFEELRYNKKCFKNYNSNSIKIDDILQEYKKLYIDLIDKKIDRDTYNNKLYSVARRLWSRINYEENMKIYKI